MNVPCGCDLCHSKGEVCGAGRGLDNEEDGCFPASPAVVGEPAFYDLGFSFGVVGIEVAECWFDGDFGADDVDWSGGDVEGEKSSRVRRISRASVEGDQAQRDGGLDLGLGERGGGRSYGQRIRQGAGDDQVSGLDGLVFAEEQSSFRFEVEAKA